MASCEAEWADHFETLEDLHRKIRKSVDSIITNVNNYVRQQPSSSNEGIIRLTTWLGDRVTEVLKLLETRCNEPGNPCALERYALGWSRDVGQWMLKCTEDGRLDFTKYDAESKWAGTASTAYRSHLIPQKNAVVAFELSARAVAKTLQAVAAAERSYWADITKALIALAAAIASAAMGTMSMNPVTLVPALVAAISALAVCAVTWSAAETTLTNALSSATGALRESMKDGALDGPNGSWPAHYNVDLSDGSVEVGAGGKVDGSDWSLKQ